MPAWSSFTLTSTPCEQSRGDAPAIPAAANRHQIRQLFRQRRRALSLQQQQQASEQLLQRCLQLPAFETADKIAAYLAADGELDPVTVIQYCWQHNKQVYLPVLHPFCQGHLVFVRYLPDSPMRANCYGIAEPHIDCQSICPLAQLDMILSPLVAFDRQGNRLGMGGGFYDRTLAPVARQEVDIRVVGLAHDCQLSEGLPVSHWDIPMDQIVTPSTVWKCGNR